MKIKYFISGSKRTIILLNVNASSEKRSHCDCVFHLDRGWRYAPVSYMLSIATVASQCLLNGAARSLDSFFLNLFSCSIASQPRKTPEMLLIPEIWASTCCFLLIGRSRHYNQQTKYSHGKYLQSCVLKYQNSFSILKEKQYIYLNFFNLSVQAQLTFINTLATYPLLNLSDLAQGLISSLFKGGHLKNMKQVLKQKDISTTWRKKKFNSWLKFTVSLFGS